MFRYIKISFLKKIMILLLVSLLSVWLVSCGAQTQTPTQTPTAVPVPTPTPSQGQSNPLFPEEYYAVLPGEGAYYNVFDCYGNVVGSFQNLTEDYMWVTGLYPKDSIAYGYHFSTLHAIAKKNQEQYQLTTHAGKQCYWTYDYNLGQICVYDKQDNLLYATAAYPKNEDGYWYMASGVLEVSQGFLVYICDGWSEGMPSILNPVMVGWDGTITQLDLGDNLRLTGTLGDNYLIVKEVNTGESWLDCPYAVCDYNGNIVAWDILPVTSESFAIHSEGLMTGMAALPGYAYISDGKLYNTELELLEAAMPDSFATEDMVYIPCWTGKEYASEVTYLIDGIPYVANADGSCLYAVQQDTLYLIQNGKQFSFACNEDMKNTCQVDTVSNGFIHVLGEEEEYIFRIADGKCIWSGEQYNIFLLKDSYFIMQAEQTISVYDLDGTLRYQTDENRVESTYGDYVVLQRGPYIGIADLDGNYILKTIIPNIASDSVWEEAW